MRITKLAIHNIGIIVDASIPINKPLLLFYGDIRNGKTTILQSVRWACGGEFPADIIRHGEKEAKVELEFDGGMISRSWYVSKEGDTKARPVVFIKAGKPVASPVGEIKRLLNPFLLDQDFLRNKTELERKQYFTEIFGVDTSDIDTQIFKKSREASSLRSKISGYGEIELEQVNKVDTTALKEQLCKITSAYSTELEAVDQKNKAARDSNLLRSARLTRKSDLEQAIEGHRQTIKNLEAEILKLQIPVEMPELSYPGKPDTAELEKRIEEAGAINVRAEQYEKNKARAEAKAKDEEALFALEADQRKLKKEKLQKLKEISSTCGIKGLEFDEAGNFIYQNTTAGMISDSQIMQLSSELSSLYPEGFGLDLIDRAESLGKSIFEFVDRAKAEKKTILATIVGERPAKVPPEVGVFVVEEGTVKA